MKAIGGGYILPIQTRPRGLIKARIEIFRTRIGIIQEPADLAGRVLITRSRVKGVVESRDHGVIKLVDRVMLDSVFSAYRQQLHIVSGYEEEHPELIEALTLAERLNETVLGLKAGTPPHLLRRKIALLLAQTAAPLMHANDERKKEALIKLHAMESGVDSQLRVNKMAYAARTIAVQQRLRTRLTKIESIEPRIVILQYAILELIHLAKFWMNSLNDLTARLLSHDGIKPMMMSRDRNALLAQCRYLADNLDAIDYNPYRRMAAHTTRDLREICAILRQKATTSGTLHTTRQLLIRCKTACAVKEQQLALERIIFGLRVRMNRPVEHMRLHMRLKQLLRAIGSINDSILETPVIHGALPHLQTALVAAEKMPPKAEIETVISELKSASAAL